MATTTSTSTTPTPAVTTTPPVTTAPTTTPASTGTASTTPPASAGVGGFFSRIWSGSSSDPTASTPTTAPTTGTGTAPTTEAPAPTVAATPPVAPTGANPVDVALAALRKSAVDTLWEQKNALVYFLSYIGSFFSNTTDVAKAYIEDKDCGHASFINTSTELVQAAAARHLNGQETPNTIQYNDGASLDIDAALEIDAKNKTAEFYNSFKKRISSLGINENSPDFGTYLLAAQKQIAEAGEKLANDLNNGKSFKTHLSEEAKSTFFTADRSKLRRIAILLPTKIEATQEAFGMKVFDDMVNAFASQPLESITIESMKQKITSLKTLFSRNEIVDIEFALRQAIRTRHETAINTLRGEFADPSDTSPRMQGIITSLSAAQTAERTSLMDELDVIRGSNGFNGTYNAAQVARNTAENEKNSAKSRYFVAARQQVPANDLSDNDLIALLTNPVSSPAVEAAKQEYIQKHQAFVAAEQAFTAIKARFDELAVFTGRNITGGRIGQLNANLDTTVLANQARVKAGKLAGFYGELNQVVGDTNKIIRSNALNRFFA